MNLDTHLTARIARQHGIELATAIRHARHRGLVPRRADRRARRETPAPDVAAIVELPPPRVGRDLARHGRHVA